MMTKDEILNLEAGRRADNFVAEHVMRWPMTAYRERKVVDVRGFTEADKLKWKACSSMGAPDFSTDLNAAREMESELERLGLAHEYAHEIFLLMLPRLEQSTFFVLTHTDALTKVKAALIAVTSAPNKPARDRGDNDRWLEGFFACLT